MIAPGTRLGDYEIVGPLGAGGMGEVYRARDARLGRSVAIKVLAPAFSNDPDRLARFEREARLLASLNHPNIATVHGTTDVEGGRALVMELVDGETLSDRIARAARTPRRDGRGLPIDETLAIAGQIAAALDAAHERGIVHRDLKPTNIKLTPDGVVKVLDFGLAKTVSRANGETPVQDSHIATVEATHGGLLLGTAPYMSPEQARGQEVDRRADIWAFGCILYEMLTGRMAFSGATTTETLAAILERAPDWTAVSSSTPPGVLRVLRRCLEKNPKARLRDIADAQEDLSTALAGDAPPRPPLTSPRSPRAVALAFAAGAATVALAAAALWPRPGQPVPPAHAMRFSLGPPAGGVFMRDVPTTFLSISPDGTQLAFVAVGAEGRPSIWLRRLSELEPRPIAGTEGARSPFWSPDGRSLAFFADGQLKRVDAAGGTAVSIAQMSDDVRAHGAWSPSGTILLGTADGLAIRSIPAAGGTPRDVLRPDPSRHESKVNWPAFLPDGTRFVYSARKDNGAGELRVAHADGSSRGIVETVSNAQWVDPDWLVFTRDGVLLAQRFDLSAETLLGDPFPIGEPVDYHYSIGRAIFAASRNGVIAYHSHSELARLVWFDRSGRELGTLGEPGGYQNLRISPSGTQVLFDRAAPRSGSWDLWTADLARGVETRVTSERGPEVTPVWLRDESGIVYGGAAGGAPRLRRRYFATGADEPLLPAAATQQQSTDISPDGKTLIFAERDVNGNFDGFTLPLAGGTPVPFITSPFMEIDFRYSPDGRAVSFMGTNTGRAEVYLKAVDPGGARLTVSGAGGYAARWSRDGRELFYVTFDGKVMSVPVRTTPALQLGSPKVLFTLAPNSSWMDFDVSLDGQKFLAVVPQANPGALPLTVIANWPALLNR